MSDWNFITFSSSHSLALLIRKVPEITDKLKLTTVQVEAIRQQKKSRVAAKTRERKETVLTAPTVASPE